MQEKKLMINVSVPVVAVYILAVTFVFEMRSVWTTIPRFGMINNLLLLSLVVGTLLYVLSRKNYHGHFLNGIITTVGLAGYFFIYYFYDQYIYGYSSELLLKIILRLCCICLLCFAMREEHKQKLFETVENIVLIIASVSLFFWIFGSLLGVLNPSGIEYTTWIVDGRETAINKYYNLYFETQTQNFFGAKIMRNSAIFTEGPMCSFMFCYAIFIELFKKKHTDYKKIILLSIAVLSTFSTTGYVIVIAALFIKYMLTRTHNKLEFILRIVLIPVVLIAVVIVFEYLLESKLETTSGSTRIDDFVAGLCAWRDQPLMGNGFNNSTSIIQYMSTNRMNNTGLSNSLVQMLAYGGLYIIVPYVGASAYGIYKIARRRDWNEFAFVIMFIIMFIFTITSFQMLSMFSFFSTI